MIRRMYHARVQLNAPAGGLNPMNIEFAPASVGDEMLVLEYVIGPDNYAASRTLTATYGGKGSTIGTLNYTNCQLWSEGVDNVRRTIIPRQASSAFGDTYDTSFGLPLINTAALSPQCILLSGASMAEAETFTIEIKALLLGKTGLPAWTKTATSTWTAHAGGALYESVVPFG